VPKKVRVLFVCMGNCVRSQMAEALARHLVADIIEAQSAGLHPLGFIDATTREVLTEEGIPFDGQFSKGIHTHDLANIDLVVNMSGAPGAGLFHGNVYEDWPIRDPFGESVITHRRILAEIRTRVLELADRFRASAQ